MVYSFIISDLNRQILYANVFNFSETGVSKSEIVARVVRHVKTEFDFNSIVTNSSNVDFIDGTVTDFETKGILNVNIHDKFKPAVWHSYCGCLYILVCDDADNRSLASRTLILMIRTLRDLLPKITNQISEIIYRADVVSIAVNAFLPSGQLLFLHNQAVQQISKDLQKALK